MIKLYLEQPDTGEGGDEVDQEAGRPPSRTNNNRLTTVLEHTTHLSLGWVIFLIMGKH